MGRILHYAAEIFYIALQNRTTVQNGFLVQRGGDGRQTGAGDWLCWQQAEEAGGQMLWRAAGG